MTRQKAIFFDFDGVIKDTLSIKAHAFAGIFEPIPDHIRSQIIAHHLANPGVSRFEKLPYYLRLAGLDPDSSNVEEYARRLSTRLVDAVISSPWLPGVQQLIKLACTQYDLYVVSSTPHHEINMIVSNLFPPGQFCSVHGSPSKKTDIIAQILADNNYSIDSSIVIGDSSVDQLAASHNNIKFLLVRNRHNRSLICNSEISTFQGIQLSDLSLL